MKTFFDETYKSMIRNYLSNPDKYVFCYQTKNKSEKLRNIVTYKDDENGRHLRAAHIFLKNLLPQFYESSNLSFAYKKGKNCLDAVREHIKSNFFIKLDIKSFFENIKEEEFLEIYSSTFDDPYYTNNEYAIENIRSCFYKGHLSLGYVTSPLISDIYLSKFDNAISKFLEKNGEMHYSRYCDDILISYEGDNWSDLKEFYFFIVDELAKYGLSINEKKMRQEELSFLKKNSISFLGLTLSKNSDNSNKITISKNFILFIITLLKKYYNYGEKDEYNEYLKGQIMSRIAYIKYNSSISYNKFLKKHKNIFGTEYNGI